MTSFRWQLDCLTFQHASDLCILSDIFGNLCCPIDDSSTRIIVQQQHDNLLIDMWLIDLLIHCLTEWMNKYMHRILWPTHNWNLKWYLSSCEGSFVQRRISNIIGQINICARLEGLVTYVLPVHLFRILCFEKKKRYLKQFLHHIFVTKITGQMKRRPSQVRLTFTWGGSTYYITQENTPY